MVTMKARRGKPSTPAEALSVRMTARERRQESSVSTGVENEFNLQSIAHVRGRGEVRRVSRRVSRRVR